VRISHSYSGRTAAVLQDSGDLRAFAYVWGNKYRHLLSTEEWSFDHFLKHEFASFWKEELEDLVGGQEQSAEA
jgi:hypothetical protein